MTKIRIYHNPNCSKSRRALEIIEERGIEATVIRYLESPPDAATLSQLLSLLEMAPAEIVRTSEAAFKKLGKPVTSMSEADILQAIVDEPILLQRPIVVVGDRATIGRPSENVSALLDAMDSGVAG